MLQGVALDPFDSCTVGWGTFWVGSNVLNCSTAQLHIPIVFVDVSFSI